MVGRFVAERVAQQNSNRTARAPQLIQSHACRAAGELDFPKWGAFGVHFSPKRPNGRPLGGRLVS